MNKILALLNCLFILFALAGCDKQNQRTSNQSQLTDQNQEKVFPEVMVGVWEAEVSRYSKWGIKFEPDGSILKIIHSLAGPVKLEEGGTHANSETEDAYYVFVMGPCEANYMSSTGILKVKIVVDHFMMKLPQGELDGRIEDYFEGPISEDGTTWKVNWLNYGWLEGSDPPDPNIIEANPIPLVFTKLDIK